jgi:hypothetical protein
MSWVPAAIIGGSQLLGGIIGGNSARSAAETSANAQLQAGQLAAEAQKFRPVGITSRFGTGSFQMSPEGYLQGASYQLSPELQAIQDYVMGQTRTSLGDVTKLQELGRGYLAQTPEQAAADWLTKQQAILAPSREKQLSNIRQGLFNTGRGGLSVAQGGDLSAANPELQAYYNALAQQDLQLAGQAQQAGQQQVSFGQGLLSSAYSPLQTGLGLGATIEALGQSPLDLGAQLGGRSATSGANVGQSLLSSGLSAAKTTQAANAFNPYASALTGFAQNPAVGYGLMNYYGGGFNPYSGWTGGGSGQVYVPGEGYTSIGNYFNG